LEFETVIFFLFSFYSHFF